MIMQEIIMDQPSSLCHFEHVDDLYRWFGGESGAGLDVIRQSFMTRKRIYVSACCEYLSASMCGACECKYKWSYTLKFGKQPT